MTLDQINDLINKGYIASGILAVAIVLILIYEKLRRSPGRK